MRFVKRLLIFVFLLSQAAMSQNITRLGRWSEGQCTAVFNWGKYTFIGNGAYLEAHQTIETDRLVDRLLIPGPVNGIWAQTDLNYGLHANIYLACGDAGLQVAYFDVATETFLSPGIIGSLPLPGTAEGVMQYGSRAYVACGTAGFALVNVGNPGRPQLLDTCAVSGFSKGVWVVNDSTALIAADSAGLMSINTAVTSQCYVQDDMTFTPVIPGANPRIRRVIVVSDTAYVAAGWGGMRIVKVLPSGGLDSISVWSAGTLDVQNCWVTENARIRFAHLACGENGIVAGINVTNPHTINPASGLLWDSPGFAYAITVSSDTAFVSDGYGGLALVRIDPEFGPQAIFTIPTMDDTRDVAASGTTGFAAVGRSGVKIFDIDFQNPRLDSLHLRERGSYNTQGEARGLKRGSGNFLFVADGSRGLTILNVANPQLPVLEGLFTTVGDTCYDVAVPAGSYAVLACGQEGLRVVNYSGLPSIVEPANGRINTPGLARGLETRGDSLFVADSSGVFVYRMNGLPSAYSGMTLLKSLVRTRLDAHALAVAGDSVFVANGQYGFLIWNTNTGRVDSVATLGRCGDLTVKGKTIYLTDSDRGLSIVDLSKPNEPKAIANAVTSGDARRLVLIDSKVLVADGPTGMAVFNTTIKPTISISTQSIQFGSVPPNFDRPWPVWITNTGTTLLQVTGMEQAGDVGFSISETSFSISPQDTQRIFIRFAPTSPVDINRDAVLVIYSNDPDHRETQITLKGKVSTWVNEGPYASDSFTLGLWHADDAGGQFAAVDASANHFTAQISGGAVFSDTSLFGRSVAFVGPNNPSRMSIPFNAAFDFSASPFTVEFWYRMNRRLQHGERSILFLSGRSTATDTRQIELALSGDLGLTGRVWNSSGTAYSVNASSMTQMNPDQWYHAAFSWDGDSLRLYMNGVLKKSARLNGFLKAATDPLVFGTDPIGTEAFEGYLDEARISNVARESWEFHVNRSRLAVDVDTLYFGKVMIQKTRRLPLHLANIGTQQLEIRNMAVVPAGGVNVGFSTNFALDAGRDTTLWATFAPTLPEILDGRKTLVFETSDPTYVTYRMPLSGEAVQTLPAGKYESDALTLGLWHFNERSGDTTFDASGHRLVGRLRSMSFDTTRRVFDSGSSLGFGNTGGITVIDTAAGSLQSPNWNGMTVEAWFRLNDQVFSRSLLVRRGTLPEAQFELMLEGNTLIGKWYNTQGDSFRVSTLRGEILNQQWYHAALVLDSDSLSLYLNSAKKESVRFTGVPSGSIRDSAIDTLSILIGRDWSGNAFNGNVDELRISNVARQVWEFNVKNARIATSAGSLDFSRVLMGSDRTIRLELGNIGLDTLFIDHMAFPSGSPFAIDVSSLVLLSGATRKVNIRYTPQFARTDLDSLSILTNDPNWQEKPFQIPVRGIGISSALSGAYQADAFTAGLYHFNEGSGTTTADSSGFGRTGLLRGDAGWSESGRFDGSLRLPGGGGRVIMAMPAADLNGLTLEGWFYLTATPPDSSVLMKMGTGLNRAEIVFDADSGLVGSVWQDGIRISIPSGTSWPRTNQWIHSALTWDGDSLRFYTNAILAGAKPLSSPISLKYLSVGADSSGTSPKWQGNADEIRISTMARRTWEMNVAAPRLETVPKEKIAFSPVLLGASRTARIILRNIGNQDLSTKAKLKSATVFKIIKSDSVSFLLGGGKEDTLVVAFRPVSSISYLDSLIITSNEPAKTRIAISISGKGLSKQEIPHEFAVDSLTVALYHFSEISGDTTHDETARYPARLSPEVERTRDGLMGRALKFIGQNGNVQIPRRLDFERGFLLEGHFQTDTVNQLLFDQTFGPLNKYPFSVSINPSGRIVADGLGVNGPMIADNAWHGLAFLHRPDTDSSFLYLDGVLIESARLDTAKQLYRLRQTDTTSLWIGSSIEPNTLSDYKGFFDELRISEIGREPWEFNLRFARVAFSQDTIDFGRVVAGAVRSLGLNIRNVGLDTLFVEQMGFDGTSPFVVDTASLVILPGLSRRVNMDYKPKSVGYDSDSLLIYSNDPNWMEEPLGVQLHGEGIAARLLGSYQTDAFTMGLYHFEDAAGTSASDSSGLGRSAVLRGDAGWSTVGRFGGCLNLPGQNGRIVVNQTNELIDGFTLEGWFKLTALPRDSAVFIRMGSARDTNRVEISFDADSGLVGRLLSRGINSVLPSTGSIQRGQWTHTALAWDGDSLRFYINNIPQSVRAFGGPLRWSFLSIGADSSGVNPWNGLVDEVRFSSTARRTWDMNVSIPQVSITPKNLDFSTVLLGASRTFPIYVANAGDQELSYRAKLKTGQTFRILGADSILGTLSGGRIDTLSIVFRPVGSGIFRDTLVVKSNDPSVSNAVIPISGLGFNRKVSTELLADSLTLALYHFNELTGDTAADQMGRYTARLNNLVSHSTDGLLGRALSFAGNGARLEIPFRFDFSKDLTIECHFKTDTVGQILFDQTFNTRYPFRIELNNEGRLLADGLGKTGPFVGDDSWHGLSFIHQPSKDSLTLYLDGVLVETAAIDTARQKHRIQTADTSRIFLGAVHGTTTELGFQGLVDELRVSSFAREQWNFGLPDLGIRVVSIEPQAPRFGEPIIFKLGIPPALSPDSVFTYYRHGGKKTYTRISAIRLTADTLFQATIPAMDVTLNGIEYFLSIRSTIGVTYTYPSLSPDSRPFGLNVRLDKMASKIVYAYQRLDDPETKLEGQMVSLFSIPFRIDTATVRSVLAVPNAFGAYDPYLWRLYWWHRGTSKYLEYSARYDSLNPDVFKLEPGRAFWVVAKQEKQFEVRSFQTVSTETAYSIPIGPGYIKSLPPDTIKIAKGWNMIGNPYPFLVRWQDCILSSDSVSTLYAYDGPNGFRVNSPVLEPWHGYFICNQDTQQAMLTILPKDASESELMKSNRIELTDGEWMVRLSLQSDQSGDIDNFAGCRMGASDAWDTRDLPEPPSIVAGVSIRFNHPDWNRHAGVYTADLRSTGKEGQVWEIEAQSQIALHAASLSWEMIGNLPRDWKAYILDPALQTSSDIQAIQGIPITMQRNQTIRFVLVAGTSEFVARNSNGIPWMPSVFRLYPNYPNPFNPETQIRFSLPKRERVELVIFNALGQKVAVLIDKILQTGEHQIIWNGKDGSGRNMASGVYLYRLKQADHVAVQKMILLR